MRIFSWILGRREFVTARPLSILFQGILHITAIYIVARSVVPWLLEHVNNTQQYFASHMVLFGLVAGIAAGFINGRFWRHSIVRFVWMCPVLVLALALFSGPGVYLTMPLQSDWGEPWRFYFTVVSVPAGRLTGRDQTTQLMFQLAHIRAQFLMVVPAVVGITYSLGALLSGLLRIPIPLSTGRGGGVRALGAGGAGALNISSGFIPICK